MRHRAEKSISVSLFWYFATTRGLCEKETPARLPSGSVILARATRSGLTNTGPCELRSCPSSMGIPSRSIRFAQWGDVHFLRAGIQQYSPAVCRLSRPSDLRLFCWCDLSRAPGRG